MSLLPSRVHVSPSPDEPRVLDIDGDGADTAFDVLGSETARRVLATTYEEPRTPPEIREEVGTSLQNVHYHLDRLESAGLLEPAGTGYSEKGTEMTVYAPASEAVVLFAGDDDAGSRLRDGLQGLFGLVATVALATLVFAVGLEWLRAAPTPKTGAEIQAADAVSQGSLEGSAAIDPVLAFFLGGLVVVAAVAGWWFLRARLPSAAPSR